MKATNKQTAVEFLEQQIRYYISNDDRLYDMFEQAKEMERQQIMTAFSQGDIFGADYYDGVNITEENYYNQTFKDESNS